ncbi:cytochrome P450 9e2-like [Leguminivora glycinivorella]|uniref:cytochrome P450 9e2-like n=1 Tax=Leguminivora glycinivorella TaxID=1035111 RepID=UPI00200BA8E7|nr:cytochrome P450 9e2-like [Leguminivora glycinivorella]
MKTSFIKHIIGQNKLVIAVEIKMIFLIWILAISIAALLYCRQTYARFAKYGVKHLPPVPLFGDMAKVFFRMEHFLDNAERIYNSFPGERFVGHMEFIRPIVFIRDVDLVKRVTVKDFEHFLDHAFVVDKSVDPMFGRNLLSLKGQEWKDMRSTLSPAFTSSKIKLMVPLMEEAGENMNKRLKREILESGKNYADVDIKDVCNRYANDVIASCAFGLRVDSQNNETEFYKMGKVASQFTFVRTLKFLAFQCIPGIMKFFKLTFFTRASQNFFRQILTQTMRDRETHNIIRPDMVHLLMEAKKGNLKHEEDNTVNDAGFATVEESNVGKAVTKTVWTEDDLIAQAVIFFVAGFEGVAQAMAFLVYELALNPEVQDKLAREVKENDEKNCGKFNYTSIKEMTYLDMVVTELLRMWTPGGTLERICTKDYNLGRPSDSATEDYIIRKGEGVKIPVSAIHHDPQYFSEPHKFDPERFSPENRHKIHPFSYNPFGCGPRNCIASRFALCEIKVLIYQLIRQVEVSPCKKTAVPIKLDTCSFNLIIKGGHWIKVKARE